MDETDSGIRILSLKVKDNITSWKLSIGYEKDTLRPINDGTENFNLSTLEQDTVDLLVEQLQLLADIIPSTNIKMLEDEMGDITNKIYKLIRILGEHLYQILFTDVIRNRLNEALNEDNLKLLRIELEFENEKLASWPWEYLYRPVDKTAGSGKFLAETTQLVLNRRLSLSKLPLPLNTPRPVKILVVVSKPKNLTVECARILETIRALTTTKVVERIELIEEDYDLSASEREPIATFANFQKIVEEKQPHIIHFIGHGRRTIKGGQIAFVKEGWEPDWIRDEAFATWAAKSRNLKLVFLQACESALPNQYRSISGMARQLAQQNIPAVVAMQYKVESQVANTFACAFYESLAKEQPVDLAVKAGREAVDTQFSSDERPLYHAFGLPVLYLSSYQSLIVQEQPTKQRGGNALPGEDKCPGCGTSGQQGKKYCSECGIYLLALRLTCLSCGYPLEKPLAKFCNECGTRSLCIECGKLQIESLDAPYCKRCKNRHIAPIKTVSSVQEPLISVGNTSPPGIIEEKYIDPAN